MLVYWDGGMMIVDRKGNVLAQMPSIILRQAKITKGSIIIPWNDKEYKIVRDIRDNEQQIKEMLAFYEEPKPHFNTLSTIVRGLEDKGFLAHYIFGNTYQYYPIVSEEDFRKGTLRNVISKYFNNSYLNAVSSLVKEEDISLDELRQLIQEVEKADRKG